MSLEESTMDRPGTEFSPRSADHSPAGTIDVAALTGGVGLEGLLEIAGFGPKRETPRYVPPAGVKELKLSEGEREANLERNLRSMPSQAVRTIRKIAAATARKDVAFYVTGEGAVSAVILEEGQPARQLASLRRPREEAATLTRDFDPAAAGATAVLGFGLGYHVEAMARVYKKMGVLLAFEPDVELLRAVLEHVDHSAWFELRNCVIVTDPDDQGEITASIAGSEGIFMLGTKYLEHPASKNRLGSSADRFGATLSGALRAVRTSIVTTLVQVDKTIRNLLGNVESYVNAPGIDDLAGAATGKPAIVVSAGPSLWRNIDLLSDPEVRSKFVVIAVQTVLKTLLAKGIRPDFVTALDHDAISRRFYEGLTKEQVEGVTLVVEPKASPAIIEAFPGSIRCPAERILDGVLNEGADDASQKLLWRNRSELKPGATVAHLAYYLARHMGCDPVIFIGQDLGFTDGQYYAAGAAIHQVWSGELNEFNTLEMLEWQRIVRQRSMLHRMKDQLGRDCYSDEQMTTYLVQFERDFGEDVERGMRIIDATEGGVSKRHARAMTLREAIDRYASAEAIRLPSYADAGNENPARRDALYRRLRQVRADIWRVSEISRTTAGALEEILAHHGDQARVNGLIATIEKHAEEVQKLTPAYSLVQHLNQTGILNRFKADRAIELEKDLGALEKQKKQAERDLKNVTWLADAADELGSMFDSTLAMLKSGKKLEESRVSEGKSARLQSAKAEIGISQATRVVQAVIPVDFEYSGLGTRRDLARQIVGTQNALQMTVARLARSKQLKGVTLLTTEPARVREMITAIPGLRAGFDVSIIGQAESPMRARRDAIRGARMWAGASWRGGIANVSVFDEVFSPAALRKVFGNGGVNSGAEAADGLLLVGADWCFVDPALVDQMIERFGSSADLQRLIFSQAVPGLAPCILQRTLAMDYAEQSEANGALGSIGTILGYLPIAPQADLIARAACVSVEPIVRDAQLRLIADREDRCRVIGAVAAELGAKWVEASAAEIARRAAAHAPAVRTPEIVRVELCAGRFGGSQSQPMDLEFLAAGLHELGAREHQLAVVFDGGDPLLHPRFEQAVEIARNAGAVCVHARTELLGADDVSRLLHAKPDVISIDLHADKKETYRALRGLDELPAVQERIGQLVGARRTLEDGLVNLWVVPRITRRDAVYAEIESFYDRWIMTAGAAVIDALVRPISGERIGPLPVPRGAKTRMKRMHARIRVDGALVGPGDECEGAD